MSGQSEKMPTQVLQELFDLSLSSELEKTLPDPKTEISWLRLFLV